VRRLAHDFGNILTGILGFSELALAQQLSPGSPLHTFVSEIHRGAQNGAQYTSQLRLLARRQPTSTRFCNVSAVLAEEQGRFQPLLSADVQLKLDLGRNLPAVAVESESLKQALAIVLENAREAITGAGVIEVCVQTVQLRVAEACELFGEVRPGAHLEIQVADSGSGVSAEVERQLFAEPFVSTKSRKRGFGLAMAYAILAAHRGGLELRRLPEGGTIARLLLPVAAVAAPSEPRVEASTPAHSLAVPRSTEPVPSTDRILVVDDDPMILQLITTTLERAGYRVLTATNAEEAVKSYRGCGNDPFRLVLSDVLMPEVNGIDLARRLLAQDANVAVLFMSGQVPTEILHQTFGPDRFEVLSKPFRPEGLIFAVRAAIARASAQRRKTACGMPQERLAIPHSDNWIP
jgi:CheY-like chemotaxis protein